MYKYKRVCKACMTASHNHTEICVNGCDYGFMTIDDYTDQAGIRNTNDDLVYRLEELVRHIKAEIEEFDRKWTNTWDTKFDIQVEVPSVDEMKNYNDLVELP